MKINLNETSYQEDVEIQHKKLEAGLFGKLFGTGYNAASNIAGLVIVGILITMFCVLIFQDPKEFDSTMKIISPILTLTLGYLFGKHAQ